MPLAEVLQALSKTPSSQAQLRAALATTCARWQLLEGDSEEAVRHLAHALEMVPDLRPAMRLLYRVYLDRGDVRSAVMYLDQEIRATRHPREAAALYRERGQLVEAHFHDLSAAQQCYQAALKATPRDLAVLRSVERVLLGRGDVFVLSENLEAQLEVVQEPKAIAGLLHELALIEARHKGEHALAGDMLLAALEQLPAHPILAADLFRIAEATGDAALMLGALEAEAEGRSEEHRALPLARASVVLREQRERGGALALLRSAARSAPHNFSLWRNLEELAMATSRYEVAAEACIGQIRAVGDGVDGPARAELYYRLGKLALFRLERPQEGLAAMRRALRLSPGHPPTLEDTGRYLNAGQMWSQQLEFVNIEIAAAGEAGLTRKELAQCHLRGGQIMEEHLGEYEGARKAYREASSVAPSFRPPRDRLERVLHQVGDTEGLKRYYAEELEQAQTPSRRSFLRVALGQLHSGDEDPSEAIAHLQANLEESETQPSMQLLARLLARAGRNEDLLDVTELEIEETSSPSRRAKLMHRAGELALAQGDDDRARELFEGALEAVDDHLPSLEALGKLLRQLEDWEGLVELLRKELLYANDRSRQVGIQLEVAHLLSARLGKDEDALSELQALLRRWPRHLPALHAAERIAARLERHELLLSLLEQHIGAVGGPRTRALLLHRAARIRARNDDKPGAIRDLVRALELWPQLGVARAQLLRMYELEGRTTELQAFAEAGLSAERGPSNRRAMAMQLAELAPTPVIALQYLGPLVEADGADVMAQLRLARASALAHRPSRQAGALTATAEALMSADDASVNNVVTTLRYRAARAEEAAGNLDEADQTYARVLDQNPAHILAQRGRKRIATRKRELAEARDLDELLSRADSAQGADRAALLNMAAELHERRLDLAAALGVVDRALEAKADFRPALHARARLLERIGNDEALTAATETLEALARGAVEPRNAASALCRAGSLALRSGKRGAPNPRAWSLFCAAAVADPNSTRALRGLIRTRKLHGLEGAPVLVDVLPKSVEALHARGELDARTLREIGQLGAEVDGAGPTIDLLERGIAMVEPDSGLYADLAQVQAKVGEWPAVVTALQHALELEQSPERRAALHFYAGEGLDRIGDPAAAVEHYIEAGRGGFHPVHALTAAIRLADAGGLFEAHARALELLVEATTGIARSKALHALARLHRGPLHQPQRAVDLLRDLLQMSPTETSVVEELCELLGELDRADEGKAVLLAGIAHHRSWIRASSTDALDSSPVEGLRRLFAAVEDRSGVYLASAVLETVSPERVPEGGGPDDLQPERWPLPAAIEGRPLESIATDLDHSGALDLLREGAYYFGDLPFDDGGGRQPSDALPGNNAVVMVAQSLARALGLPTPLVFLDDGQEQDVKTSLRPAPCLVVGRRVAGNPADPAMRNLLGRALFRLATGGDALHDDTDDSQLLTVVFALCRATGQSIDHLLALDAHRKAFDEGLADSLAAGLPDDEALEDLVDFARAFAKNGDRFHPRRLRAGFTAGQDRAGALCAGDPRPALRAAIAEGPLIRARALISYLMSDDHLNLRRAVGYHLGVAP